MKKGDIKKGQTYIVADGRRMRKMVCIRVEVGKGPCVTFRETVTIRRYNDDGSVKYEEPGKREIIVTTRQVMRLVEVGDEEWHR